MRRNLGIAMLAGGLLVGAAARAQPLPPLERYGVRHTRLIFDDFAYAAPLVYDLRSDSEAGGAPGSLYGRSAWAEGGPSAPAVGPPQRAWFAYDWAEQPWARLDRTTNPSATTTEAEGDGRLVLRLQPGPGRNGQYGVSTGFAAATGFWVARMQLGPLPPPGVADAVYAFWLQSAEAALQEPGGPRWYAPNGKAWHEVNFELWNQPFRGDCGLGGRDQGEPYCPIGTGITWWGLTYRGRNQYLRPDYRRPEAGCRWAAEPDAPDRFADHQTCLRLLTRGDIAAYYAIRITDERLVQYLYADDPEDRVRGFDRLYMETGSPDGRAGGIEHVAPPHPMRALLSIGGNPAALPHALRMEVDWLYYTPEAFAALDEVIADVAALRRRHAAARLQRRGAPVRRINTTGLGLRAPFRDAPDNPCYWAEPFGVQVRGPFRRRMTGRLYFDAALDPGPGGARLRQMTSGIRWRIAERLRASGDGARRTRTHRQQNKGFGYEYPGPPAGYALERLELEVTYTSADEYARGCQAAASRRYGYTPAGGLVEDP